MSVSEILADNSGNGGAVPGVEGDSIDTSSVVAEVRGDFGEVLHLGAKLDLLVSGETGSIHHGGVAVAQRELERFDAVVDEVLDLLDEDLLLDSRCHLSESPSGRPLGHQCVGVLRLQSLSHRQA